MAVDAAGLGKLKVISALGQPLRAEIDLIAIPKDEVDLVTAKIATVDAYKQARLDRQEGLGAIQFSIDKRPSGEPYLKVSSVQTFNEPFLQLLIQLDWPTGRLLREYTILLDPPGFQDTPIGPAISAPVTPAAKTEAVAKQAVVTEAPIVSSEVAEKPTKTKKKSEKSAAASKSKAKKDLQVSPILKAEPSRTLTPAEQTFPRFDGDQERPAASEQQAAPITTPIVRAEQEYLVKKGDSLSKIARGMQVEGYSLEQMMVALYETNKDAFEGKNMNRIKTGKTLNVPNKAAIDESSANQSAAARNHRGRFRERAPPRSAERRLAK